MKLYCKCGHTKDKHADPHTWCIHRIPHDDTGILDYCKCMEFKLANFVSLIEHRKKLKHERKS